MHSINMNIILYRTMKVKGFHYYECLSKLSLFNQQFQLTIWDDRKTSCKHNLVEHWPVVPMMMIPQMMHCLLYIHIITVTVHEHFPMDQLLPQDASRSILDKFVCGDWRRTGMLCGQCNEGYNVMMNSPTSSRHKCDSVHLGILFLILSYS